MELHEKYSKKEYRYVSLIFQVVVIELFCFLHQNLLWVSIRTRCITKMTTTGGDDLESQRKLSSILLLLLLLIRDWSASGERNDEERRRRPHPPYRHSNPLLVQFVGGGTPRHVSVDISLPTRAPYRELWHPFATTTAGTNITPTKMHYHERADLTVETTTK